MTFRASVLTLYPEMFPGPLGASLAGEGLRTGLWSLEAHQIREHGIGRHRNVDDTPAGGGAGMVLRCDVLAAAIDAAIPAGDARPRLLMSPRGRPLSQRMVRDYVAGEGVVIVCGRFEGVDERVIEGRGLTEVSVGDYILSGGEMAAMVLLDACVRLIPGVMGKEASGTEESFENGLLEYPHYTRPREWEGRGLPEALLSGDHARIARWRREQAERITRERRPDLLSASSLGGEGGSAKR
ncbi:MAG: tRNA (guanosine(37)-N1)-methyltransferase TrmD [Bosea sp.]|uniref:tRNA (guanosine(37)-N1)-methyltransferase TrmD n=1 Tax=Bosea sp. (in: a-proteobacteria) TaxID=1871050 RepID=UPI00238D1F5E|nr:tRNA (guanosine(37)-N1)-methyltransferase TrmD [Bosea sp. (in: a-proteobacteria)]MCP4733438.1 tRNA (guanosine(37)-N1)-methyltransferase TrmD [Bosea sp. (in: a-proteobacteria)]